jgi:hypothetical protein
MSWFRTVHYLGEKLCKWLDSSVVRAAEQYSEGPKFKFWSGCTFFSTWWHYVFILQILLTENFLVWAEYVTNQLIIIMWHLTIIGSTDESIYYSMSYVLTFPTDSNGDHTYSILSGIVWNKTCLVGYYYFFLCIIIVISLFVLCLVPCPVFVCSPLGLFATSSCCLVMWGLRSLNAAFPCWFCLSYHILLTNCGKTSMKNLGSTRYKFPISYCF